MNEPDAGAADIPVRRHVYEEVPRPERWVTRADLAEIMGVHVATVDRWIAAGIPSETWGLRARRFQPSVAIAWARERGITKAIEKRSSDHA